MLVDMSRVLLEDPSRTKLTAVMSPTVHAHFEAARHQVFQQSMVERVAFGDEVERRSEAKALLEVGDSCDEALAVGGLDVVSEHQGVPRLERPEEDERHLGPAVKGHNLADRVPEEPPVTDLDGPAERKA